MDITKITNLNTLWYQDYGEVPLYHLSVCLQDFICCEDYKNYTVLVAVCMRQMVERMRTAPPSIISVKPNTKVNKKRLMEEKALSM